MQIKVDPTRPDYSANELYITAKAGNGGVKVREFVDIFCAHSPKPRQSEEKINKILPHLMPKIPPLFMVCRNTLEANERSPACHLAMSEADGPLGG